MVNVNEDSSGFFIFSAVNLMNEEWCWEEKSKEIEVVDQNLSGVTFRQSGYILSCHLSHDITLVKRIISYPK